ECVARENAALEDDLVNATTTLQRLLRDRRRALVSNRRHQRGHDAYRLLDELAHSGRICRDAFDTAFPEHGARVSQRLDAAKQTVRNHGLEHVELQLPGFGGERDCDVATDDVEAHLVHDFWNHRIDLAGHDRRSWLHRRQVDLAQPRSRTGAEQAKIIAD